jgi:hypothetical protein
VVHQARPAADERLINWRFWRRRTECRRCMPDEHRANKSDGGDASAVGERERRLLERSVIAYAAHLRSVARCQRSVIDFRRAKSSHDELHSMLDALARNRAAAIDGRTDIQAAVRDFVHALRADHRAPEIALGMTKRAVRAIVVALPLGESLPNPETLLDDTVRWAIQAYYEAA